MAKATGKRPTSSTRRGPSRSNRPSGKGTSIGSRTKAQAAAAHGNALHAGLKGRQAESARYSTGAGGSST